MGSTVPPGAGWGIILVYGGCFGIIFIICFLAALYHCTCVCIVSLRDGAKKRWQKMLETEAEKKLGMGMNVNTTYGSV